MLTRFTDYSFRWAVIGICGFAAMAWLLAIDVAVNFRSILPKLELLCILFFFSAAYAGIRKWIPRFGRPLAVAVDCCLSFAQLLVALAVLLPVTYLAASTNFPLVDAGLSRLDAIFGFDWDSAARWVGERPVIDWVFQRAYFSFPYQAAVILVIGSFRLERNSEILWLLIVSVLMTSAIFAFTPAAGKIGQLGVGYFNLLMEIRRGDWSTMNYVQSEGIITFPSFHATLAIILAYAVRRYRWALAVFAPLNCLVIISIPTVGGHYLVDLFGGAVVAGLSILFVHRIRQFVRRGAL